MSSDEIMAEYPDLESEDISQCLIYAAWLAGEESIFEKEAAD